MNFVHVLFCAHVQAAQVVLIAMFELNTPEFTMLLGALPKTFQDGTTKLLHNHLRSTSASSGVGMVTHPTAARPQALSEVKTCTVFVLFSFLQASPSNSSGRAPPRQQGSRSSPLTSPTNCSHGGLSPRYFIIIIIQ